MPCTVNLLGQILWLRRSCQGGDDLLLSFCKIYMFSNCLLNIYVQIYTCCCFWPGQRKFFFAVGSSQCRDSYKVNMLGRVTVECSVLSSTFLHLQLTEHRGRGAWKNVRARECQRVLQKLSPGLDLDVALTNSWIKAVGTHTRHAQDQANRHPSVH